MKISEKKVMNWVLGFSFLLFLQCGFAVPATAVENSNAKLAADIGKITDKPIYKHATWGILIKDSNTGKILYQKNPDKLFVPGSTTKLFTTAAALQAMGADYRYKTYVYQHGKVDSDGNLNGDIILVASGDITMGGRQVVKDKIAYTGFDHTDANAIDVTDKFLLKFNPNAGLESLAKQIAAKGIKHIQGDVIVDTRLFKNDFNPEDPNLLHTPIVINDNVIDFVIKPGKKIGDSAIFYWQPKSKYYQIDAEVRTVAKGEMTILNGKIIKPNRLVMRGQIPLDAPAWLKIYNVNDPASFARSIFVTALENSGVKVDGSPLAANPADQLPPQNIYRELPKLAVLESPPLSENIKLILKVSHNLGADLLPLQIAVHNGKATFEEGMVLEKNMLDQLGVDTASISIGDGTGLSRANLFTPNTVTQLLEKAYQTDFFQDYYNALPILGVDGTLAENIPSDSPAKGKVHAKTGTIITGDLLNKQPLLLGKGLAGYIDVNKDKPLIFAIYVNGVAMSNIDKVYGIGDDLAKIAAIAYKNQSALNGNKNRNNNN